jgi:hypothetical protein
MQKQGSLGRRLVIALLATAVIGAVCWAGALYLTRSAAERLCEQYAERVQAVTTTVHRDLARLAAQPATIAVDAAGVGPAFVATVESNPLYITVGLSDADGNSIFSTYRQKPGTSLRDRRYFQQTLQRKSFAAGEFVLGKMSGLGVFHFSLPVNDLQGQMTGTINIAVNLQNLEQILALNELPKGAVLHLVDHRGAILSTNQEPLRRLGHTFSDAGLERLKNSGTMRGGFADSDKGTRYHCGRSLLLPDGTPYAYLLISLDTAGYKQRALLLFELLLTVAGAFFLLRVMQQKKKQRAV